MVLKRQYGYTGGGDTVEVYRALDGWGDAERADLVRRLLACSYEPGSVTLWDTEPGEYGARSAAAQGREEALKALDAWPHALGSAHVQLMTGWRGHSFWVFLLPEEIRIGAPFTIDIAALFNETGITLSP